MLKGLKGSLRRVRQRSDGTRRSRSTRSEEGIDAHQEIERERVEMRLERERESRDTRYESMRINMRRYTEAERDMNMSYISLELKLLKRRSCLPVARRSLLGRSVPSPTIQQLVWRPLLLGWRPSLLGFAFNSNSFSAIGIPDNPAFGPCIVDCSYW